MGADDHLVLAKEFLQFNSVVLPLCTIERLHHNFDHDDVIASDSASAAPEAFGRRTTVRSEAAEPVSQPRSDVIVVLCWEAPTPHCRNPAEGSVRGVAWQLNCAQAIGLQTSLDPVGLTCLRGLRCRSGFWPSVTPCALQPPEG